ncbi:MAG: hypothetical protein ACLQGP_15780 [Isosphaeraceae bacterium]
MSDAATSLIIPVRFAIGGAAQDLQSFNAQIVRGSAQAQQAVTQGVQAAATTQTAAVKASATAQTKADQDAAKARVQSAKDAATLIAEVNRSLAERQAEAARETAAKQKEAAQKAFEDWKSYSDKQHQEAMRSWDGQAEAAKEASAKQKEAAAQAFADWKHLADEQHRETMRVWEAQEAAKVKAARDAATLIARTNQDLADKAVAKAREVARAQAEAADAQAAAAKEAAVEQKEAAAQTFNDWKKKADDQHRAAMWSWEDQQAAIKKTSGEAKGLGNEMAALYKAQMALHAGIGISRAIGRELEQTANWAKEVSKEFTSLRKSMQEVAALRGKENSNEFTVEEARKAQAAGLTPEERREFQGSFLNYAGSQVGGKDAAEQAKQNTKLTEAQGEEFGNRVAVIMKASGVDAKLGAELAGSMLEQAEGPQDVEKLMKDFSEGLEVSQKGPVPLKRAATDMSRIMSHGISFQEAAKMYAIVSPAARGEEVTSVEGALRGIQKMKNEGKGAQFGVKEGMSDYESVKAFATNINERQQKLMAGGLTEKQASDRVEKQLADAEVVADYREARGLVRGFGNQGVRLGGFERYDQIQAGTSATYEQDSVDLNRRSAAGKQNAREAAEAVARAERGSANVHLEELRQETRTQLTKEGRFEKPGWGEYAQSLIPATAPREEQQTNLEMIRSAREKLGQGVTATDRLNSMNNMSTNNQMKELLELIKQQNELMKKDAQRAENQGRPPLAVPPPARNGGARMGG